MERLAEEWRAVVGWEGYYDVSSWGRVRSLSRAVPIKTGCISPLTGRVLAPRLSTGYPSYMFSVNGKKMSLKGHRLVAESFIPNPNKYPFVNHINGNKLDGNVKNLEWCTPQQNSDHARRTGLLTGAHNPRRGEKHPLSKLTEQIVHDIRSAYAQGVGIKPLATKHGICTSAIRRVCNRTTWKHVI